MMQASSNKTPPHPNMVQTQYQLATPATQSGRLKYANPRDLPSFPSHGLRQDGAAAGAAASLGWANQKSIQTWTPDKSSSASTAAMLANDYKPAPSWEPNSSAAGAKAALLATTSTKRQTAPPVPQDTWGSSAANQAFKSSRSAQQQRNTNTTTNTTATTKDSLGSLSAAKDAMATSRPRAKSSPIVKESYPGESRAAANALSAATIAHGPLMHAKAWKDDAGSVPYTTLPRSMFTSHPPVAPEVDEQKRADVLHASAVAMAKKMYSQQQKMLEATRDAHKGSTADSSDDFQPSPYVNLQEAAYKLAQDRLSKLHDEHQKNRDFQEYYGSSPAAPNRRFTMRGKLRRRSSSDGDIKDRKQSERIREQMSIFSTNLTKVDEQKRTKDREALMVVAQRNVKARLQGMDEKVYADTGKTAPSRLSEWEIKAHTAALAMHESRAEKNKGKLDVGGGMFMDPTEVDAIAAKRVQPVLDEINEKAAVERERLEVLRLETEMKKQDAEKRKSRDREIKEINRKYKEQEKQEEKGKRQQEKDEQKAKREEEKAVKAEEKRLAKEEKRKIKEAKPPGTLPHDGVESPDTSDSDENEAVEAPRATSSKPTINTNAELPPNDSPRSPNESGSPTSKMKSWLKSRFSRPRSKSGGTEEASEKEKGFIGGAALKGIGPSSSTASLDNRFSSMREVALAGTSRDQIEDKDNDKGKARGSRAVSLSTTDSDHEKFVEARDHLERTITPPAPIRDPVAKKSSSPIRDSRFLENI